MKRLYENNDENPDPDPLPIDAVQSKAAQMFNAFSDNFPGAQDCLVFMRQGDDLHIIGVHGAQDEKEALAHYTYGELQEMIKAFLAENLYQQEEKGTMQ